MSDLKQILEKRKQDILEKMKPLKKLEKDLREVEMALFALEPPKCSNNCSGCDICRSGPNYR